MLIPKSFKLGKRVVYVRKMEIPKLKDNCYGAFYSHCDLIAIATKRPTKQVTETFWHEATHAILHDMKHSLWDDEKFVTAFSKRLAQVVDSAVL